MNFAKKIVLMAAAALLVMWAIGNFGRITDDDEGFIRFVLGCIFAIFILLRWKRRDVEPKLPGWVMPLLGGIGALMALYGIIFSVHQFEWLGLILILYACLRWALPVRYGADIALALFMLYWVHPLPGKLFGQFQMMMQLISVNVSEWALHGQNVRVWADGVVLYTNGATFGVPESCSGMRTAVTVVLCTLGTGILLRLKWYQLLSFLVLSVVQVLVFNVIRISGMVFWSPRMPPEWATTFLHDTLGIFLFMSIMIIQLEMSWYKYWSDKRIRLKTGILQGELESPDLGTVLPHFWRFLSRKGTYVTLGVVLILVLLFSVIKSRPSHRNEMVREVVPGLVERDPELASRAIEQVLAYDPGDIEMQSERIRVLLKQERFEEVLVRIDELDNEPSLIQIVWKSWALMALDRVDEAVAVISGLPDDVKQLPGIAIVHAEYAARQNEPEDVSKNIVLAAKWTALSPRVRNLFPYLAAREQWGAIAACNSDVPFEKVSSALIAIRANLRERDIIGAEQVLRVALDVWPEDAKFLRYITWVALNRPGEGWEDRMAANFKANVMDLPVDLLAEYLGNCFKLRRPDLAWIAYVHLRQEDPDDPALPLAVVQFGEDWFKFARKDVGVPVDEKGLRLDLRELYKLTANIEPLKSFWDEVPLQSELAADDIEQLRAVSLVKCLFELKKRSDAGLLSYRMQIMYPFVLAIDGDYALAHRMLAELLTQYPDKKGDLLLRQATLYTQEKRWGEVYETLREYNTADIDMTLGAVLQNINAMIHLDMGISAMQLIADTQKVFPGAKQLALSEVALWTMFGFNEDALFVLDKAGLVGGAIISPQLLYYTGRFKEADKMSKVWGLRLKKNGIEKSTLLRFAPAELVIADTWPKPFSDEDLQARIVVFEKVAKDASSVFSRQLAEKTVAWCKSGGKLADENIDEWEAIGRDKFEKGDALHRLTLLAIQQEHYPTAKRALLRAIKFMPHSPVLHRMQIKLAKGYAGIVKAAREACPNDSEIWLADMVVSISNDTGFVSDMVIQAASNSAYSVRNVVRAGDMLYSKNIFAPAKVASEYGVKHGYGILPAYVLGLRCAIEDEDWSTAMRMALGGAYIANDPTPFYKTIVQIKMIQRKSDGELINALEYLRNKSGDNSVWIENLGFVYYKNKNMSRALSVLAPLIENNIKEVRTDSLILAAEAARQQGEGRQAINIIEAAHRLHPKDISVLNNLVYYLSMNPATVAKAHLKIESLLAGGSDSFEILDTVAMVYLYSGNLELARKYMDKAIAIMPPDDPRALETRLNMAKILLLSGNMAEAKDIIDNVGKNPDRNFVVDEKSKVLLEEVEKAIKNQ
ncbi:MAG: archaeosortase/exosortase family protein [Kiritimatiellae bacterium]|nr:archaeosortase/exosortase family protein [Kiritimatiellia bacterium]